MKFSRRRCLLPGHGKTKKLTAVFVNGNPGCMDFYINFLSDMADMMKNNAKYSSFSQLEVVSWSHKNHNISGEGEDVINFESTTYEEQVDHSNKMISHHCKDSDSLMFIGHSIGCKIVLEILQSQPQLLDRTCKVVLLMPFVLWRNLSLPHKLSLHSFLALYGPRTSQLIKSVSSHVYSLLRRTSRRLKHFLIWLLTGLSGENLSIISDLLLSPRIISNFLSMGYSELRVVRRDEEKTLDFLKSLDSSNSVEITALYTSADLWAPILDLKLLQELLPHSKAKFSFVPHLTHSFCLIRKSVEKVLEFVCHI